MEDKNYLMEAFQALKGLDLNEEVFDITDDGIAKANNFMDYEDEVETVIDPLAETEEDLQDSYIGKAILDCVICQSKIYKDPNEVVIDEETNLANVGEICPYCQSVDGYKIIGQVSEYNPEENTEVKTDDTDTDVKVEPKTDEENVDESIRSKKGIRKLPAMKEGCAKKECSEEDKRAKLKAKLAKQRKDKAVKEDLNNVQIETDKERITVSSEPKESTPVSDETITPVDDETKAKFKVENPDSGDEPGIVDIDINEFDENDFDELGEKYLRNVYENVLSYKTVKGSTNGNKLKLEGVITFKSGKKAKTNFVFEAKTVTKTGKLKFLGENTQFAKKKNAFTLTGRARKGKLFVESLNYNYSAKDTKTGKAQRLYGTVSKIKK